MGDGKSASFPRQIGKMLCRLIASFKGWHYRSHFINNMAFGGYNKKFAPARTPMVLASRNPKNVDTYLSEDCSHIYFHGKRLLSYVQGNGASCKKRKF